MGEKEAADKLVKEKAEAAKKAAEEKAAAEKLAEEEAAAAKKAAEEKAAAEKLAEEEAAAAKKVAEEKAAAASWPRRKLQLRKRQLTRKRRTLISLRSYRKRKQSLQDRPT